MSESVKKRPSSSDAADEQQAPQKALRVESFELSEAIKEAIKINLQIAKNASSKK